MEDFEFKSKIVALFRILSEESTSFEKLENALFLVHGIDPRIEAVLSKTERSLSELRSVWDGDMLSLSAEFLPEETEKDKKRKKKLLFLIADIHNLEKELDRVSKSFKESNHSTKSNISIVSKLFYSAKGPFGLITLAAVIIVIGGLIFKGGISKQNSYLGALPTPSTQSANSKIKAIQFNGKLIPLSSLANRSGPDCYSGYYQVAHYHALDHTAAIALDGSSVADPGGCGFGKVSEVAVIEVDSP